VRRGLEAYGAVLALLVAISTGAVATSAEATTSAAYTVDGCAIQTNPSGAIYTRCPNANLSGVYLAGADLDDANLSAANLSGASLTGAQLRGADLRDADLTGAMLTGADLSGANLTGADLIGSTLSAVSWSNTICPDGSSSYQVGGTCVDDLMVLEGAAVGVMASAPSVPPPNRSPATAPIEDAALPLTGRPVTGLAITGTGMVALGLAFALLARLGRVRRNGRSAGSAGTR
jgi:hypothetical protein